MVLYWFITVGIFLATLESACHGGITANASNSTTISPFPETLDDAPIPCSDLQPAGLDFQTLDLIAVYHLDYHNATGVTLVQGSQDLQRAYRIGDGAKLTLPLRDIFPSGLPRDFTVVGTFNAHGQRRPWSLVRARSDGMEFSLTLLPVSQRIAVYVKGARAYFRCPQLFRPGWHKIHVGVGNRTVQASVDCQQLEPETIGDYDLSNATTLTIVSSDDGHPTPIDLQWLSMSCNTFNITSDSCKEIEAPESLIAPPGPPLYNLGASSIEDIPACNQSCPPGPSGPEGPKGQQGERGFTGLPGIRGRDGNAGQFGPQGLKGDKGDRGAPGKMVNVSGIAEGIKGDKGDLGQKGETGEDGLIGLAGLPGSDGRYGATGPPGPMGPPGAPGLSGTVAHINASTLQGAKGERGQPGRPGRDGITGFRGPPGLDGVRGQPGSDGAPGLAGGPGQQGPVGPQGERGERGQEGQQGLEGPQGKPGPPGPSSIGNHDFVIQGPVGAPGEKGQKGESGYPGIPGRNGLDGIPGSPGQRGPPGLPAPAQTVQIDAPLITENEVQNICEDLIRARLGEFSANLMNMVPTVKVKRGPPGRSGSTGAPGSQGYPGEPGPRGYPGETGEPGKPGAAGFNGQKGDKGDRGPEGVGVPGMEGLRGLPGPIGPPGNEGRMGQRGDPGREGSMGPRGMQGPRGVCECPTAAYYAYAPQMNNKGP